VEIIYSDYEDNRKLCTIFEQFYNTHELKIGRHNKEVMYLQSNQLFDDICTVESNLVILDFTTCPPNQTIIPHQMDRTKYESGDDKTNLKKVSDWLHGNAAGITPEGKF